MKHRFLIVLLTILTTLCASLGFAACSDNNSHTHSYVEEVLYPATCTGKGYSYFICEKCGDDYYEFVPLKPHSPGDAHQEYYIAPTATTEGQYDSVIYCIECNTEISRTTVKIPATGGNSGNTGSTGNSYRSTWENNSLLKMLPYPSFGKCTSIADGSDMAGAIFSNATASNAQSYKSILISKGFSYQAMEMSVSGSYTYSAYNSSKNYMVAIGYAQGQFTITLYKV